MDMPLPESFVDLSTASSQMHAEVNIMGRVTDFMPPCPTRGTDWMCTFSITDRSLSGDYDEGFRIRYFKPQGEMPTIQSSGDVILLRNLKIKDYQGMVMGLSSYNTSWIVFPADSIPRETPGNALNIRSVKSPQASQPKHSEVLYAIELCNLRDRDSDKKYDLPAPPQSPAVSPYRPSNASTPGTGISSSQTSSRTSFGGRDKFALVKDLQIQTFYDIVGQVVKIYPNMGRLEMYFTDYTTNNLLYRYEWDKPEKENAQYGDEYNYLSKHNKSTKWTGPYGQMTIMVTLWPPHSHFAQSNVKEGDYVLLQNVRAKLDKDSKMEAALNTDKLYPSKIQVKVLDVHSDDHVKDVLRRKREYAEKFKAQSAQFVTEVRNQNGEGKPLSKGQKRKKQKLMKEKAKLKEFENSAKKRKLDHDDNRSHDEPVPSALPKTPKDGLSKNIRCSNLTIPTRPLSSILSLTTHQNTSPSGITYTLPFQNIKSRTTVRIIDFFPPDLAHFAVRLPKPSEFDALSDHEPSDTDTDTSSHVSLHNGNGTAEDGDEDARKWEWRFGLVLEDASEERVAKGEERARMEVYVAEQDAEFLLKLDAEDLRTTPHALPTLREKLFLLWGDLEERKTAGQEIQNVKTPRFECCLQEYGIRSVATPKAGLSEGEGGQKEQEIGGEGKWERRWRMFGTTIV